MAPSFLLFSFGFFLFFDFLGCFRFGSLGSYLIHIQLFGSVLPESQNGQNHSAGYAAGHSQDLADGEFAKDYVQPAGIVRAGVVRENGVITAAFIGGPVGLGEPFEVEIEL